MSQWLWILVAWMAGLMPLADDADTYTMTINAGDNGIVSRVYVNDERDYGNDDDTWTLEYGDAVHVYLRADPGYYLSSSTGNPLPFVIYLYPRRAWWTGRTPFLITDDLTIDLEFSEKPTVTLTVIDETHGYAELGPAYWGFWGYTGDFIPSSAGAHDHDHMIFVRPDVGYEPHVTGDTATPYFWEMGAMAGGYYYKTPAPDEDLEITVTWVSAAAEQPTPISEQKPWRRIPQR